MGQLDKTAAAARLPAQNILLPPGMLQHLLDVSRDPHLMPYEEAEIQEYSLEIEESLGTTGKPLPNQ
jgi:hypothetical protein